jgi:hypothetical protein
MVIALLCSDRNVLRVVRELNTHHAWENVCYFCQQDEGIFSLAQNAAHDPMRICVKNSLIFNYNLLTNQE